MLENKIAVVTGAWHRPGDGRASRETVAKSTAPAVIETAILEQVTPQQVQYMVQRIPMGRVGQPGEVAALIAWLASDECSVTTGQCLDISGRRATY